MGNDVVLYEPVGYVGVITLNRPEKLNAINDAVLDGLDAAFTRAREEDMRVIVLTGAGSSFSAGQDLSTEGTRLSTPLSPISAPLTPNERWYADQYYEAEDQRRLRMERIFNFPTYTIARVQGYCLGLGCQLAMMCGHIICSEDAVFGDPAVRMGNASANPLWVYRVGIRKAKDILLTGRYIDGKEAEACGLVNQAVPLDQLDDVVEDVANMRLPKGDVAAHDSWMVKKAYWDRVTRDTGGLSIAWSFAANNAAASQLQRFGFFGDFEFWKVRAEHGWKEAVRQRDEQFNVDFPPPSPSKKSIGRR